ncbi:MAG TPA: NADP-dependent oxidoreductase [Ktedonobacteraceae bacterium]|nr:NADP-dependent oxidoreductase [Ktedonobacteraceae bacterium]
MRAIAIDAYGGPERLQVMDLPIPQIGPDDVLLRVQAAGVNPADISIREGRSAQMLPLTFPAIMGSDFAGTVAQVGAHVTTVREDAQVYGIAFGGGTYAEYLRVPATGEFAALPASLDFVRAAALPMAGMTALGALDTAALAKGAVLLIVGGAGGIGTFAIQMAAQLGAHVIATARTEDQEYLRSLGAAETVDFTQSNVVEAVRTSHPGGVDAVLDVVSGSAAIGQVAQALRTGGRLLSTVYAVDPAQFAERGITAVNVVRPQGAAVLRRLSRMVEAGELRVPVQATLPLEEAARAQELLQHGHIRGKLVLTVA